MTQTGYRYIAVKEGTYQKVREMAYGKNLAKLEVVSWAVDDLYQREMKGKDK